MRAKIFFKYYQGFTFKYGKLTSHRGNNRKGNNTIELNVIIPLILLMNLFQT